MPRSGIAWDFRYQYLSGGANTGYGWETWNSSAQFPLYYAQESARNGYIPMFPYYELLQSNGSCGACGEAQKDIINLNTPSLMNSYFANFANFESAKLSSAEPVRGERFARFAQRVER